MKGTWCAREGGGDGETLKADCPPPPGLVRPSLPFDPSVCFWLSSRPSICLSIHRSVCLPLRVSDSPAGWLYLCVFLHSWHFIELPVPPNPLPTPTQVDPNKKQEEEYTALLAAQAAAIAELKEGNVLADAANAAIEALQVSCTPQPIPPKQTQQ
jgi:hypothetical protein